MSHLTFQTPKLTDLLIPINGRRGFSGQQLAQSPLLRAFVAANPHLFEPGPASLDCVIVKECILRELK